MEILPGPPPLQHQGGSAAQEPTTPPPISAGVVRHTRQGRGTGRDPAGPRMASPRGRQRTRQGRQRGADGARPGQTHTAPPRLRGLFKISAAVCTSSDAHSEARHAPQTGRRARAAPPPGAAPRGRAQLRRSKSPEARTNYRFSRRARPPGSRCTGRAATNQYFRRRTNPRREGDAPLRRASFAALAL